MSRPVPVRKVFLKTLGCPKNEVDGSVLERHLRQAGYLIVGTPDQADVEIINTCGFIEPTKLESLEAIWEAIDRKAVTPDGSRQLIVTGCLAQRYGHQLKDEIAGIDTIVGFDRPELVLKALDTSRVGAPACWIEKPGRVYRDDAILRDWPDGTEAPLSAYIKVADGCDNACRFCAIPLIRGSMRSRSLESIVSEVELLTGHGTREVILVAQDTTSWGIDLPGRPDLADLLRSLDRIGRDFWLRIMYAHPAFLSDRQIEAIAESRNMLPYIDMPLQHISDRMLGIMNRHTTKSATQEKIDRLRLARSGMAIRTTFIIGHPGETEADFEELLDFAESNSFERMGAFPFSSEEGTPAARMPETVPEEVTQERITRLMDAYDRWSADQSVDRIGQVLPCLMERLSEGVWEGRTVHDAPEIDGRITISDPLPKPGIYDVLIDDAIGVDLAGRLAPLAGVSRIPEGVGRVLA